MARIAADTHEQRSRIPSRLRDLGLTVELAPLPVGDYVVDEATIVERKTVRHLHAATIQGSFWEQIGRLRAACRRPFLVVEGDRLYDGPLADEAVRGLYLAVLDCGVRIVRSIDPDDSASWLARLVRRSSRRVRELPPYSQKPKMWKHGTTAEALLAATPQISVVTARALLDHFGSVANVVAAGPEEWMKLNGVGRIRAEKLADALGVSGSS